MWFVYILRSISNSFIYIGHTDDLVRRLGQHNDGLNQSTKHYAPFVIEVKTEAKSIELEKYFKTGSGKAILKKRILGEARHAIKPKS